MENANVCIGSRISLLLKSFDSEKISANSLILITSLLIPSFSYNPFKESLPAMGYELSSIAYDASRKTNTFESYLNGTRHMYNRVPYNTDSYNNREGRTGR